MKRFFLILFILLAGAAVYWFFIRKKEHKPKAPKPVPMALKKHSEAFNNDVDSIVNAYLAIKDAFVNADTAAVKNATANFLATIDVLPMDEMKKDTALVLATVQDNVSNLKSNALSLLAQKDITEMRHDFSSITEVMYPSFFTAINYEGQKLYYENCPMAFGEDQGANWISNSAEIVNPYLGKSHPQYKGTMLHCGEVKDSIIAK